MGDFPTHSSPYLPGGTEVSINEQSESEGLSQPGEQSTSEQTPHKDSQPSKGSSKG